MKTMISRVAVSGVATIGLAAMFACSAEPGAAGGAQEEPLGTTEQAFSAACTTAVLSGQNGAVITVPAYGDGVAYSPNDQYNACPPKQFVVEVTNANNTNAHNYAVNMAETMPANATDCANTRLYVDLYGWTGSAWVNRGSDYISATWNGSSCVWGQHAPGYPVGSDINLTNGNLSQNFGGYPKVRLAVQAFTWLAPAPGSSSSRVDYKAVSAGMVHIVP